MGNNEIKEEIKRYLETNENENTIIQNLWETGKFTVLQAYLKKQEKNEKKQSNFTLNGT